MRIVLIVTQMEGGGAQRCAVLAARRFRECGHAAETWFLFRRRGIYDDEPGTSCLFPRDPASVADYARILARLFRCLWRSRPDAVLTFSHYANVLGCLFAAICGVPRRIARQTRLPARVPATARRLDRMWGTLGIYTRILANSRATEQGFAAYPAAYRRRLRLVHDGVAPAAASCSRTEARRRLGLDGGTFCVAAVGRLSAEKNHRRLIEAVARVPAVRLLVAGGGGERAALDSLARSLGLESRVTLLGEVVPAQVACVFRAADAFVHPSLWESFGLAAVEAAAAGLPLALADIASLREIVGGGHETGALFFDPADTDAIAAALHRLASDADLRAALARQAAGLGERYSAAAMADGFLVALDAARS